MEGEGWAGKRARDFWRQMHPDEDIPRTASEGMEMVDRLMTPTWLFVRFDTKYPQIIKRSLDIAQPAMYVHDDSKQQGVPDGKAS